MSLNFIKLKNFYTKNFGYRNYEFNVAYNFLKDCLKILDVGCGQGNFIALDPKRIEGIDINPESVEICLEKGYKASVGNALKLPFDDNSFDGIHCSHVIQIFNWKEAIQMLEEFRRVCKPGVIIVITTFPDHKRLYFTPETYRAYPTQALRALVKQRENTLSDPTSYNNPLIIPKKVWLRRPPLIEFTGPRSELYNKIAIILNDIQYKFFFRKYWTYNGYVMQLINGPK